MLDTWRTSLGNTIIYPARIRFDGKQRGGIFPCAPNFGPVSTDQSWGSAQRLPQHGLLRIAPNFPVSRDETSASGSSIREHTQTFGGTLVFPWRFSASVAWHYQADSEQLTIRLKVSRLSDCPILEAMPLSGGLHPYFATNGEDFEIRRETGERLSSIEDFAKARSFPWGNPIELIQSGRVLQIEPLTGFDRLVAWSDDVSQYICIEPTFGTHDQILLEPGSSWTAACLISHTPIAC